MDNRGNDMYLSQDGYPSIDFTLLDRPSSSMVPARELVAPFSQGNSSFSSFNVFDGSGALPYNDRIVADHGNYVTEAHKNAVRRHPSGAFVSCLNRSEGVRDFFESGNQPQKSDLGTWRSNEQSAHFVHRAASSDGMGKKPFHLKNSLESVSDSELIEQSKVEARMLHPSLGLPKSIIGEVVDRSKLLSVSSVAQYEHRTQAPSTQGGLNLPASNYHGPNNLVKSALPSHQPTVHNMVFYGAQYSKHCDVSNQIGVVSNNVPSYDFLGNLVSQEGAIHHSEAAASKQLQGFTRPTGPPELESHQVQDMFVAPHFKQLESYRQQEQLLQQAPSQVSRTSYSELLHGPDTPPSQCQTTEEYDNQASDLPTQNVEAAGWSVNGPLYRQGTASNLDMGHYQSPALQKSVVGEGVASGSHSGILKDQNGPLLASYSAGQHFVPQSTVSNWKSTASQQTAKAMFHSSHSANYHFSEMQTTGYGPGNDWNDEPWKTNQAHGHSGAAQNSSYDLYMRQKGRGPSQASIFSQSQQHFQELQVSEQGKFFSEPKQLVPGPNLNFTSHSLNPAKTTAFNTMNNCVGITSRNAASPPLGVSAASGQRQWLTSSSSGSPSRLVPDGGARQHQTIICEGLQQQRGTGFDLHPVPDTRYDNLCNNQQHLSQEGSPVSGALPGPFEASVIRQQGLHNTQVSSTNVKASNAGIGSAFNQQFDMSIHHRQKDDGGANGFDCSRFQPVSEPINQGVWKKYIPPNHSPTGRTPLGQQSLDGLRPRHSLQHQGYLHSEASFHTAAISRDPNDNRAQYSSEKLVCEDQNYLRNSQSSEKYVSAEQTLSQPTPNFMKSLSRQAMKMVPDVIEDNQSGLYKFVEPQDTVVERQREVPQQQVNAYTANVSLAHLRGNHSSSSLSPQHVRLGLGPSHDLQQQSDASYRSFLHSPSLGGEVPILKSGQTMFPVESPRRVSVSETNRRDGGNTAMPVCINSPSPALRETASSDTSPTSSFASGHVMSGASLVAASTNPYSHEYSIGREPPQSVDKVRCDASVAVSRVHPNSTNCTSRQEVLNGYIGTSSSFSEFSRLPNQSTSGPPIQNICLLESSSVLRKDNGPMLVMQDHDFNNKVGNRLNDLDFKGLATASKASMLGQSKLTINNEQSMIVESPQKMSSSVRGVSGGDEKQDTVQRAPMMMNSDNRKVEEHQLSSTQYTFNDQLQSYKVAQPSNNVHGSTSSTSFLNLQGEKHYLSTNSGSSSSLQAGVPSQDSNKFQQAKSVNFYTSEKVGRTLRRPPLRAPSSVIGPGVQPPNCEDLRQGQSFAGLEFNARVGWSPESAGIPLPESNKYPSKSSKTTAEPVRSAKSGNRHTTNAQLLLTGEKGSRLDALEQQSVSGSEPKSLKISQPVSTYGFSPLPNGFIKTDQTVPVSTNFNHQSSSSLGFKNATTTGKSLISKENKVLLSDTKGPVGFESSTSKEVTPIEGPVLMSKNEGQTLPSKAITLQEGAPPSKKRKKLPPLLIPWHIAAVQPSINLPSISDAELAWASTLNRLPEKDLNATHDDNNSSAFRAKRRLILTTESMQRLFPPLPDGMMHGRTPAETECGVYSLAKLALEDACRLVTNAKEQAVGAVSCPSKVNVSSQGQACGVAKNSMLTKCVESFMERVKHLGMELARLDCSTSVSELQGETHELEKLSIVNRLAKHHGLGFTMDTSDNLFIENIFGFGPGARRPPSQRYVTAVAMPRTLPEGVRCLSL